MPIKPIFIFSVSRSGSTLLQRILAAHDGVATVSEPWLLLPFAYSFRSAGVQAEYSHPMMVDAITDFCEELPQGIDGYRAELRRCMLRLYEKAAGPDARFFLDKSPPYCLIAEEIMALFPEGKFIFLWRNPLSIISSIIRTWEPWHPTMFRGDLFIGLPRLLDAYAAHRDAAHGVRFEDLLGGDERVWTALTDYLGIEFDPHALTRFSQVELHGRMGDPTGVQRYSTLSLEPQEKWRRTLANPLRREWSRRYLRFLGRERLAMMGYEERKLTSELSSLPSSTASLLPDAGRLFMDIAKEPVRMQLRRRGLKGPSVLHELLKA